MSKSMAQRAWEEDAISGDELLIKKSRIEDFKIEIRDFDFAHLKAIEGKMIAACADMQEQLRENRRSSDQSWVERTEVALKIISQKLVIAQKAIKEFRIAKINIMTGNYNKSRGSSLIKCLVDMFNVSLIDQKSRLSSEELTLLDAAKEYINRSNPNSGDNKDWVYKSSVNSIVSTKTCEVIANDINPEFAMILSYSLDMHSHIIKTENRLKTMASKLSVMITQGAVMEDRLAEMRSLSDDLRSTYVDSAELLNIIDEND